MAYKNLLLYLSCRMLIKPRLSNSFLPLVHRELEDELQNFTSVKNSYVIYIYVRMIDSKNTRLCKEDLDRKDVFSVNENTELPM